MMGVEVEMFILIMVVAAIALTVMEMVIPSHGVLGVMAAMAAVAAIAGCFWVNQWLGLGATVAAMACAPLVWTAFVKLWPLTPVGRAMVLQPVDGSVRRLPVAVGQVGVAVSELRPMGTGEFAGHRVEVASELGMIAAATKIRIVSFENNRPVVVAA
jgi:membrane-bound ClpP family serine protease